MGGGICHARRYGAARRLLTARWRQLIDDGGRFLDTWGSQAAEFGWRVEDVFGSMASNQRLVTKLSGYPSRWRKGPRCARVPRWRSVPGPQPPVRRRDGGRATSKRQAARRCARSRPSSWLSRRFDAGSVSNSYTQGIATNPHFIDIGDREFRNDYCVQPCAPDHVLEVRALVLPPEGRGRC